MKRRGAPASLGAFTATIAASRTTLVTHDNGVAASLATSRHPPPTLQQQQQPQPQLTR